MQRSTTFKQLNKIGPIRLFIHLYSYTSTRITKTDYFPLTNVLITHEKNRLQDISQYCITLRKRRRIRGETVISSPCAQRLPAPLVR